MSRNIGCMNPNLFNRSVGHLNPVPDYVNVEHFPHTCLRGESCVRCNQARHDVKFEDETDVHRRRRRTQNSVKYCSSCHYAIQASKNHTREATRGSSGVGGPLDFEDVNKMHLMPSMIKDTQSSTPSSKLCTHYYHESVPHQRSKRVSSSSHRQTKRVDQGILTSTARCLNLSNMTNDTAEDQQGSSQARRIKNSLRKDIERKSRQKTRDGSSDSDYQPEYWNYEDEDRRVSGTRNQHQMNVRGRRHDAGDEGERLTKTVQLSSTYTTTKNSGPTTNVGRGHNSGPREINIDQIPMIGRKPETNVQNSSKVISEETSDCEQDEQREEQLQKELDAITYCGHFEPSMLLAMAKYKQTKELKESLEAGKVDVSLEKDPKVKEEENYILQRGDIDLHAMKNYILDLIDKVLSKAFSDVKKNDVAKEEEIQRTVCLEVTRLLQGDYCKPFSQSTVGHPTADSIKQLKKLRFDFLEQIQEEIRKLYNLEMLLDNYSSRQSLPIANSQSSSIDQRSDDRQQQHVQQQHVQEQQQQQTSQEQQLPTTTVANGLGKMSESIL